MSVGELLRGVSPVLAVPFDDSGVVDIEGFASIVDHVLGTGVSSVLLFGFAGEFLKLDDAERFSLLEVLLSRTRDRSDVAAIASVTDHSAEVAARRARRYVTLGADVINVLPPSLLNPSVAQVFDHIGEVADAIEVPVVVQYAPLQTGVTLLPEQIVQLATRHPNIVAVKVESQPPGVLVSRLLELSSGQLASLVGYAGLQWPDAHQRGAVGVQPGCSATELYVEAQHLLEDDQWEAFRSLHARFLPWIAYWMQSVELIVAAEKLILRRRGIIKSDYCRRPRYVLDALETASVDAFLAEFHALLR